MEKDSGKGRKGKGSRYNAIQLLWMEIWIKSLKAEKSGERDNGRRAEASFSVYFHPLIILLFFFTGKSKSSELYYRILVYLIFIFEFIDIWQMHGYKGQEYSPTGWVKRGRKGERRLESELLPKIPFFFLLPFLAPQIWQTISVPSPRCVLVLGFAFYSVSISLSANIVLCYKFLIWGWEKER